MLPEPETRPPRARRRFLWLLVTLTVLTLSLGAARWLSERQARGQLIAEQSKAALAGPSQSRAPDFSLKTIDGKTASLGDLRGKVVLINFWATWCPPCKAEMPDLNALHRKYANEHDFLVLGIDVEEDSATVKSFVQQYAPDFPVVLDVDGRVTTQLFGVRPLPTSFIIDREGFIRDAWSGQIAPEAMLARLKQVW